MPVLPSANFCRVVACIGGVTLAAISTPASAATLNVNPTGQLLGASNVEIDGSFFDVAFVDGTCVSVFSGCDDASDFIPSFSINPAQALLEQVFVDGPLGQFDSSPELINGIEDENSAFVLIVTGAPAPGSEFTFDYRVALNNSGNDIDFTGIGSVLPIEADTTFLADTTFARFTPSLAPPSPVPLPAAAWFLLAGLGTLGAVHFNNRSNDVSST